MRDFVGNQSAKEMSAHHASVVLVGEHNLFAFVAGGKRLDSGLDLCQLGGQARNLVSVFF
jgi:hypothetical protein